MKIMSADNDERPLFDGQWNFCRYRIAISAGVFRNGDRTSVMADMEPALQMVLLQPALYHVE